MLESSVLNQVCRGPQQAEMPTTELESLYQKLSGLCDRLSGNLDQISQGLQRISVYHEPANASKASDKPADSFVGKLYDKLDTLDRIANFSETIKNHVNKIG